MNDTTRQRQVEQTRLEREDHARWEAEQQAQQAEYERQAAEREDAVREQAAQRQAGIDERARQLLGRTAREHIERAARLQATPVSSNQAAYVQAQVQTELLWAQVKQTPAWTDEVCDEA